MQCFGMTLFVIQIILFFGSQPLVTRVSYVWNTLKRNTYNIEIFSFLFFESFDNQTQFKFYIYLGVIRKFGTWH